jgi:mannose/cellobiose epimerase-like protein (N-acyl-D-glucosamine 2-epimerase family)
MPHFRRFAKALSIMGTVNYVNVDEGWFRIISRGEDEFTVRIASTSVFAVLQNLDELNRDRISTPAGFSSNDPVQLVKKYVRLGRLVVVEGVYQSNEDHTVLDGRFVHVLQDESGQFLFEQTHWWLTQISRLADTWLDDLFGDNDTYTLNTLALYRTTLNITGAPTDDTTQECATLSRLIYGLSSAYLLTGNARYLSAAKTAVSYQRLSFRHLTHDGKYCFWAFGKRKQERTWQILEYSLNPDDLNTIPLYEQIYALAGLSQYYRISHDWEALDDIKKSVAAFNAFYHDDALAGYFSHLDYATMRPDTECLGDNKSRKNWNSVGDHVPAYLLNVLLALEPPSASGEGPNEFWVLCTRMLRELATLILEKFPDPDPNVPYVNERFFGDWSPDHSWKWQQNRAIIGHNFKIAWNLTRIANYSDRLAARNEDNQTDRSFDWGQLAKRCVAKAVEILEKITPVGIDQLAGGAFDAVERNPPLDQPVEFTWSDTKDFWQQEQAILAYLIVYGRTKSPQLLELARETATFWNLFFLDHDNRGIFFRVTDAGLPYIQGNYGNKGGHAISGYHVFELNYLAHIYIRTYVPQVSGGDASFSLHFRPTGDAVRTLNVLPDCMIPNSVQITAIEIDGVPKTDFDPNSFHIHLGEFERDCHVAVHFGTRTEVENRKRP